MVERVLFPFRGAELGGSHVATFALAAAIQRRSSVECVVLCPQDTLIMEAAKRQGFRTVAHGEAATGGNNAVTDITRIGRRRSMLKREAGGGPCVVHCNDVNTLRAWGLPARLAGMGVVYHHHALNRMWWPPHLVSITYANAVVCVSDNTLGAMRGWRRDAIKELNPFSIDTAIDRQAARAGLLAEFGWPDDAVVVGWVGNFWERKRPAFFLQVAAELARRDQKYRFVMFGRDGDHAIGQIRAQADQLGVGGVTAAPGIRQPVEANLACLDLLLAPAPREPFGRALVEAIILGTPVVATRGAGHSEIIGAWGGGRLADANGTPESVADLCESVVAAPDTVRLSPGRAAQIAAELDPDAYAGRMLNLYERISRPRRTPASAPGVSIEFADTNSAGDGR
jgi:glycosyltransferase involved in cell wall biosynthesis